MFKLIEEKLYIAVCCGLVAVNEKLEEKILKAYSLKESFVTVREKDTFPLEIMLCLNTLIKISKAIKDRRWI